MSLSNELIKALALLMVLSIFIERALTLVFEWKWWKPLDGYGLKSVISFGLAFVICQFYAFDLLATLFGRPSELIGRVLTAMIIAGGSKVVLMIFRQFNIAEKPTVKDNSRKR